MPHPVFRCLYYPNLHLVTILRGQPILNVEKSLPFRSAKAKDKNKILNRGKNRYKIAGRCKFVSNVSQPT